MSAAPDPAELAPSRDLAAYGRRPLRTAGFLAWASLCLLCVLAGWAVGRFGAQITPPTKVELAPVETTRPSAVPSLNATPAMSAAPAEAAPAAQAASVSQLSDRVARLEATSGRGAQAAAAALAAADLSQAAQSSGPFDQDLAAYQRLIPNSADAQALALLAAQGAPSRADLAASLPDRASFASAAAHEPAKGASFLSRAWALIGRVVIIRRIDPAAPGVDGVLAQAQAQAAAGDLEGAVASLGRLPPAARPPLADWVAAANRRSEIDRRIEALRSQALGDLVQAGGRQP